MTLTDLYNQLKEARERISALGITDPGYYDLVIQTAQLRKEIALGSFDVDAELSRVVVADFSKLRLLTGALAKATSAAQVAPGTIGKIVGIGKVIIRSLGIGVF